MALQANICGMLFAYLGDVAGAVEPGYRIAHRRLELADGERKPVDEKNQVESLAALLLGIDPLVGDDVLVLSRSPSIAVPKKRIGIIRPSLP